MWHKLPHLLIPLSLLACTSAKGPFKYINYIIKKSAKIAHEVGETKPQTLKTSQDQFLSCVVVCTQTVTCQAGTYHRRLGNCTMYLIEFVHTRIALEEANDVNIKSFVVDECITENGPVRLVGALNIPAGRAEVFSDGRWGTICDGVFDTGGWPLVFCTDLGYHRAVDAFQATIYPFPIGTGDILLHDASCCGTEVVSIFQCRNPIGNRCNHTFDVVVKCE